MREDKQFIIDVECVIEKDGRFLIIRRPAGVHAGGTLSLVGGGLEVSDGEGHQDPLVTGTKREVLEEVGLDLQDPVRFVGSSFFVDSNGNNVIATIFHCKLDRTKAKVIPSQREVPEYFWMTIGEINAHPDAPEWTKRYIAMALA